MAARRRPNLAAALVDLGFAIGAGACGAFGLGWHMALGVVAAHLVYWGVSRRAGLQATPRAQLLGLIAISVALLAAVDFTAFFLGQMFRISP